jgi:hypothetical protein
MPSPSKSFNFGYHCCRFGNSPIAALHADANGTIERKNDAAQVWHWASAIHDTAIRHSVSCGIDKLELDMLPVATNFQRVGKVSDVSQLQIGNNPSSAKLFGFFYQRNACLKSIGGR